MDDVKNDIKMLFYIVNSLVGLLIGLVALSFSVTFSLVPEPGIPTEPWTLIPGLILLTVAALGYAGAILQNRIMLFIYAGILALNVVYDIVRAGSLGPSTEFAAIIIHLGLTVLAIILAVILTVKARKQTDQGRVLSSPLTAYTPGA